VAGRGVRLFDCLKRAAAAALAGLAILRWVLEQKTNTVAKKRKAKLRRRRMIFLSFCDEFTYKFSIVQKRVLLHKKELA